MWTLSLDELDDFLKNNKNNMNSLQIEGFQNLLTGLDEFFEEEPISSLNDFNRMQVFSLASLESTNIICTIASLHGSPMFSNVVISSYENNEEIN